MRVFGNGREREAVGLLLETPVDLVVIWLRSDWAESELVVDLTAVNTVPKVNSSKFRVQ